MLVWRFLFKDKGTVLCPDLHNIPQLPSTREGKEVDWKPFMNEKWEAATSTEETLGGQRGRFSVRITTTYLNCQRPWKDKGTVLCPNPYNIIQLSSTREGKVVD